MELYGINTQNGGESSVLKNEKALPSQGNGGFATLLQTTALRFDSSSRLPNAGHALSAHFERPREVETANPQQTDSQDNSHRATSQSDNADSHASDRDDRPAERVTERRDESGNEVAAAHREDHAERPTNHDDHGRREQRSAPEAQTSANDAATPVAAPKEAAVVKTGADEAGNAAQTQAQSANQGKQIAQAVKAGAAQSQFDATQTLTKGAKAAQQTLQAEANKGQIQIDPKTLDIKGELSDDMAQLVALKTGQQIAAARNKGQQGEQKSAQNANAHSANAKTEAAHKQTEDLAALVGADPKMAVKVEAAQSSATVSAPMASLVQAALLADEDGAEGFADAAKLAGGASNGANSNGLAAVGAKGQNTSGQNNPQANLSAQAQTGNDAAQANTQKTQEQNFTQMLKSGATAAAAKAGPSAQAATAGNEATPQLGAAQGTSQTTQTQSSAPAQQAQTPKPVYVPPQEVVDQIKVKISKEMAHNSDTIKIQLTPEHLGKIEIKMELAADGKVQALVIADNKDTLELLKQDAKSLEKALQEAGLKADSGSLNFEHRGEEQRSLAGRREDDEHNGRSGVRGNRRADIPVEDLSDEAIRAQHNRQAAANGRVDYYI